MRFFAKQPNCIGFSAGIAPSCHPTPFSPERGDKKRIGRKKNKKKETKSEIK